MRAFVTRNPVFTFVVLTWILQWGLIGVVMLITPAGLHVTEDETAHMVFRLRLIGPLLVCLAVTYYLEGGKGVGKLFAAYTRWKVPGRWYMLAFTWKFINAYLAIGFVFLIYGTFPGYYVDRFWEGWAINLPAIIYIALMEETSWMKFGVTRLQMRYNALTSALLIAPKSNLASVKKEKAYFTELARAQSMVKVNDKTLERAAEVEDALANQTARLYHFACHGDFESDNPNDSRLLLLDSSLRPSDIIGPTQVGIEKGRPLVFLNACTSCLLYTSPSPRD